MGHRFRTHGRKILLSVGRLTKQKGFDQLISNFATLARSHANWDLIILGEGEERTALEAQIVGADLTRRIKLPGRVNNVSEWYAIADLFVLSSASRVSLMFLLRRWRMVCLRLVSTALQAVHHSPRNRRTPDFS